MMSETVVTMDGSSNNATSNPRQVPTVKTEPGQPGVAYWATLNLLYFKTIPGILKLVQFLLGMICMICASPARLSATHWFLTVVVTSFICTVLWCVVYGLSLREVLKIRYSWIVVELCYTGVVTLLYFTAFIGQLAAWSSIPGHYSGGNITGGVFGVFNCLAYAAGTYFLYVEYKNSSTQ